MRPITAWQVFKQRCALAPHRTGSGTYTIEYLQTSDDNTEGILMRGDLVRLYVPLGSPLTPGTPLRTTFLPAEGQLSYLETQKDVFSGALMQLYP